MKANFIFATKNLLKGIFWITLFSPVTAAFLFVLGIVLRFVIKAFAFGYNLFA